MTGGLMLERLLRPVAGALPATDPAQVSMLAARLEAGGRRRGSRAMRLLHVGTGGCGGCAMEIAAFEGPSFDLARAGLSLTASPLQADILLVTGPGARNAAGPLRLAWEAMAPPRHVIAVGDCAAGDGLFAAGYAIADGGVGGIVPVDLVVRGAPPPPEAVLLLAILTLAEAGVRS